MYRHLADLAALVADWAAKRADELDPRWTLADTVELLELDRLTTERVYGSKPYPRAEVDEDMARKVIQFRDARV